ncbi:hypothetical protein RUM43_001035 [Polyplax serrata]|uniref:Uncharacterized protein n=1 Tax=Polyplax serrata TaxID=468196 RepID=A0AAN8SDR4_POLSC
MEPSIRLKSTMRHTIVRTQLNHLRLYGTQRWVSQHPAVSQKTESCSPSGFPRNHPMYWTLPPRSVYGENKRNSTEEEGQKRQQESKLTNRHGIYNKLLNTSSSQKTGAIEPSHGGVTSLNSVDNTENLNNFTSSTPTKEKNPISSKSMSIGDGMSPILKENLFNSKSKMTAEEIFAAIHKSKKKLNLKEELESRSESPHSSASLSPDGSEKSLSNRSRERSSWSPNTEEADLRVNEARTRRSWTGTGTPINSFKKLLLQQGIKSSPSKDVKMSAVEQLKLSKQARGAGGALQEVKTPPRSMVSNNRGRYQWRFRTDVLSSTIPEDCSEVEKPEEIVSGNNEMDKSNSQFVRSNELNRNNLSSLRSDNREMMKPRENKSLEITKKYLQQARKNFFNEPSSANVAGAASSPARKQLNMSGHQNARTTPNSLYGTIQSSSTKNYVSSSERRKSLNISLETAL